jgi:tetratricopeptide (TPR) repeat protein
MIEVFAERIVWISADGRPEFALSTLLDEIATQLGDTKARELALELKKEAVRELIAQSDALVALDNFETISPDEQKLCAGWIARHAPCPALITTRSRVDGARNVPINRMTPPEANEFIDKLIEQTQNAHAFSGLDRDRVIKASEANPLVMQWVIAQIDEAQQPSDVLDDLARGEGDAADRVFDRSFNLPQVGSDGRDTLLALSLFAPSASRRALAEVAGFGGDDKRLRAAVRGLGALRLVQTTGADERWIIEGLTRDLAKARLLKDERVAAFRRRFVESFTQYAKSHSETSKEDFDALETELENIFNAMDVAFEIENCESVMQIRSSLEEFLDLRGYWDEAIQRGEQAVKAAQAMKDEKRVAVFAWGVAIIRQNRGEYEQASSLYKQSLEEFKKLGSETNVAAMLHQLGRLVQDRGEADEARRLYNESLDIAKRLGNQSGIAITLHQLGMLAQDRGEVDEARRLYNESLEIKKRLGNQSGIAITLHQLGTLAEKDGNNAEAVQLFLESLTIFEKLKSPNAEIARRSLEIAQSKLK